MHPVLLKAGATEGGWWGEVGVGMVAVEAVGICTGVMGVVGWGL